MSCGNGIADADREVEQPMKIRLIINTQATNELGLTMPPSMLTLAGPRFAMSVGDPKRTCFKTFEASKGKYAAHGYANE